MKNILVGLLCIILGTTGISQEDSYNGTDQRLKILMVLSNATHYGNSTIMTANHFGETVVPYDVFASAGYEVDNVSPKGGRVPIGYINAGDAIVAKYIHDRNFIDKINRTKMPTSIDATEYGAIFYSGGGAAIFGVPEDKSIQKIAIAIYEQNGGVIFSICHGAAGLVDLKKSGGEYLVAGKKVNGFPDSFENMEADYYKQFPFSIQQKINNRQVDFVHTEERSANHYIVDGRLATGQDPSSAKDLALKIIELL